MSIAVCPTCGGTVDAQTGVCPQCTTQVASPSASATATAISGSAPSGDEGNPEISGYRVLGRLGEGGMGAVYLAEETTLGRRVAVKVISSRMAPDAQSKARFLREARTLATIEHPHVVRVYSFGEVEGRPYLAMEFVDGETLTERIARMGRLPLDDALRVTRDVVDALDAAWESQVIHRDIKPSNILIDRRNRVRVADFGLAKPKAAGDADAALTQSGLMVGTPHYISPEQAQGREVDFRSDFYSLGIMLYHMLTGERPFQGSTPVAIVAKHLHEPMPSLRLHRADLPEEIERLILWMTAKDPDKRPASHRELLAALDALITRTPTAPLPTFSTVAIPKARPGVRSIVIALAALLFGSAAVALYVWRRQANAPPPAKFAEPRSEFVVAVAPFYGPDEDSAKEGRVMAALIERAVAQRLRGENARVAGIEETKTAVRSHDDARELGKRLAASAVIWGEAFALRTETEIRPYVTVVTRKTEAAGGDTAASDARLLSSRAAAAESLADTGSAPVRLEAEAPNQIELRKTSASGIGDVVVLLAGIHALENESNHAKALALFRQAPRTAETLRYEVQALLRADRRAEAQAVLEKSLELDPGHATSLALLGDLHLAQNRTAEAIEAYRRAAATGEPYTTTRGIAYDGKLYRRETYRHAFLNNGTESDSLALLAVDPTSARVVERYSMPGVVTAFRIDGEDLFITYRTHKDDVPKFAELRFRHGTFDRPRWPPPNLLWRMRAMRAGRVLPGNFLREIDTTRGFGAPGGRFVLGKDPAADLPKTLPDLERALRAEAERDPTQPWHLFFLAVTLRAQNRMSEANAVLDELIRRGWPGVHYYQFTWMLGNLERLGYAEWADRLYPKMLAIRSAQGPVLFSTLIERLINAPFVRQAAVNRDRARGYQVLQHARAVTGIVPEGEDFAAVVWAEHFEKAGQDALAEQERKVVREVNAHPFNYFGSSAQIDYASALTAGAFLSLVVVSLAILALAIRRAKRLDPAAPPPLTRLGSGLTRIKGPARAALLGLVIGGAVLLVLRLLVSDSISGVLTITGVTVAIAMLLMLVRVTPEQVLAATTRKERLAILAAYLLFVAAMGLLVYRLMAVQVISGLPLGLADALGHPRVIQEFEQRHEGDNPPVELRYVLALLNHYGGETARAESLYAGLPPEYANTAANHAALRAGKMPVASPTAAQFSAATFAGSAFGRLREAIRENDIPVPPAVVLFGTPLLLLALFAVRPRELPEPGAVTVTGKVVMALIPGLYDLRRGHAWRALVTLLLLTIPILPAVTQFVTPIPAVGWATAMGMVNLFTAFPMPTSAPDPMEELRFTFLTAYPYAEPFVIAMAVSLLAGLALHLSRLRAILREPVAGRQPARSNLASVST